jgi:regulator of replication initiation timing
MTAKEIINIVCNYFGVTVDEIKKHTRKRNIVAPRHICMYFLFTETESSLSEIGRIMGGYHHTTVIYARDTCENAKETFDLAYYPHIKAIQNQLGVQLGDYQKLQAENKKLQSQLEYWKKRAERKTIIKQLTPEIKEPVKFQRPPAVYSNQRVI